MNINDLEALIHRLARIHANSTELIARLETAGRIYAWELVSNIDDSVPDNLQEKIEPMMIQYAAHSDNGKAAGDIPQSGLAALLRQSLTRIYGENYVRGIIENEDNPDLIARKIIRTAFVKVARIPMRDAPTYATMEFFEECGLKELLWVFYNNDPLKAMDDAYPNEKLPWQFHRAPMGYWTGKDGWENTLFALKWFARQKGLQSADDCKLIGEKDFFELQLDGLIQTKFNCSPYLALSTIFPELLPWQTLGSPNNYYVDRINRKTALSWLLIRLGIGSIEGNSPEQVYDTRIREYSFKEEIPKAGMRGLLRPYSGNIYELFMDFYPEQILPWTLRFSKTPWRVDYMQTAAKAVRWLFEKYLDVPVSDIPSYATDPLFWNAGFSGMMTNPKFGFSSSPFKAVDNAYPGMFTKADFRTRREIKYVDIGKI